MQKDKQPRTNLALKFLSKNEILNTLYSFLQTLTDWPLLKKLSLIAKKKQFTKQTTETVGEKYEHCLTARTVTIRHGRLCSGTTMRSDFQAQEQKKINLQKIFQITRVCAPGKNNFIHNIFK